MKVAGVVLLAGLWLAAAGATQGPSSAAPSHARVGAAALPAGAILFRSGRSLAGRGGLYAVDAGGGGLKELGLPYAWEAHWSPDGRRIAFSSWSGATPDGVHVVRADGTGRKRVAQTNNKNLSFFELGQLSWSPDGRRIAFTDAAGPDSAYSAISIVGADGRGRARLTRPGRGSDVHPTWSPDGKWVAFVRDGGGCGRPSGVCGGLFLVSSDGKRLRRLPTGSTDGVIGAPSWSPDGKRLVFALCCDGGAYVINADGTERRHIVARGTFYPAWAPDGRWIALAGYGATHLVRPDGTGYRPISANGTGAPSWSPDSKAVAVEDKCCAPDIWIVPIDGSRERRLTEGWRYGYGNYDPEWNPRGLSTARLAGTSVSPANPTDSLVEGHMLRSIRTVTRLSADGPRVAMAYAGGKVEAWEPSAASLTRFLDLAPTHGFAHAGERVARTYVTTSGPRDSWHLGTATVSVPRSFAVTWPALSFPTNTPLEHLAGDGTLLVGDIWGPCQISRSPPCAREPKEGGRLYRVEETRAREIASDRGPLTLLSVDRDRILVDRENGALQLFRADGTPLHAVTYGPAQLLGAKLEGDDLVALTTEGLAHYDAGTGDLRHHRRLAATDAQLADVQNGVAVYLSGTEIHLHQLDNGRETLIRPEGRGPVLAELEAPGLFYSYADDDATHPGRIAFIPFGELRFE